MLSAECIAECDDLGGALLARVDHDAVCSRRNVGIRPCERVVKALLEDQALDARDDHELLCALRGLARCNLLGEVLDGILRLRDLRAEERVALCARLVLDDDGGDADALEGADVVGKMLRGSARVHVENDGFRRDIHDLVDGLDAVGEVDELDVRLAARGRVAQTRDPHGVELVKPAVVLDDGFLCDESGQTVVHLDRLDDGDDLEKAAESAAARLRHGELLAHAPVDVADLCAFGIGRLNELAAAACECGKNVLADGGLRALRPVAPVHDVVGAEAVDDLIVHDVFLHDDLCDLGQHADHFHALFERLGRETVVAHHLRIGEHADRDRSELCRRTQEVSVPLVDDVGAEARINFFHG